MRKGNIYNPNFQLLSISARVHLCIILIIVMSVTGYAIISISNSDMKMLLRDTSTKQI